MTTLVDGIYSTPSALTLVAGGRIRTTAVATAWGYHVTLGRTLRGTQTFCRRNPDGDITRRTVDRQLRCAWQSVPDRPSAIRALRQLSAQLGHPLPIT